MVEQDAQEHQEGLNRNMQPHTGRRRWIRVALFAIVAMIALFATVITIFGVMWLDGWVGLRDTQQIVGGDQIVMESGQTIAVPDGFLGRHEHYWRIPSWVKIGENHVGAMHRSEFLDLSGKVDELDIRVFSASFVDEQSWRAVRAQRGSGDWNDQALSSLAARPGIEAVVLQSGSADRATIIVYTQVPSRLPGVLFVHFQSTSGKPVDTATIGALTQELLTSP